MNVVHYQKADEQLTLFKEHYSKSQYEQLRTDKDTGCETGGSCVISGDHHLDNGIITSRELKSYTREKNNKESQNTPLEPKQLLLLSVNDEDTTKRPPPLTTPVPPIQNKMTLKRRRLKFILSSVILVLIIVLIVAVITTQFSGDSHKTQSASDTGWSKIGAIEGRLHVIGGPMSQFTSFLSNPFSPQYLAFVNIFETQMDLLYSRSVIKSFYNFTTVTSLQNGSVVVYFCINFRILQHKSLKLLSTMKHILLDEIGSNKVFGNFVVEPSTLTLSTKEDDANQINLFKPSRSPQSKSSVCVEVTIPKCRNVTNYTFVHFPNVLGHATRQEMETAKAQYNVLWNIQCYGYDVDFWCAVWTPECRNMSFIPPCKQYCQDVHDACIHDIQLMNTTWPLSCLDLPDSTDPKVCIQNPYHPGEAKPLDVKLCENFGYNTTVFPNLAGQISRRYAVTNVKTWNSIQFDTHCYRYFVLFACSIFFPRYSGNFTIPYHIIPPCKSLCIASKTNCLFFLEIFLKTWPASVNCSTLPESNDTSVCLGHKEATEPRIYSDCNKQNISCDNSRCLPRMYRCDGHQDCEDAADERNCEVCKPKFVSCPPPSGRCILPSRMCNGNSDCYGDLDETNCVRIRASSSNMSYMGRVEVYNGVLRRWEVMCSTHWDSNTSMRICRQLGFRNVTDVVYRHSAEQFSSKVIAPLNQSSHYIHSQIIHSVTCPSMMSVHLKCGQPVCGIRPAYVPSPLRIVGGLEVRPGSWPWIASLHGGPSESFFCTAFVISERWVLTAAHCIGGRSVVDGWMLQLGHTRREAYDVHRQRRTIRQIFVHENFSQLTVDNDIALLHVAEPIEINDYVKPVCLPLPGEAVPLGTRCIVAGWGKKAQSQYNYLKSMEQVSLNVVDSQSCERAIESQESKPPFKLTDNMFCAGGAIDHDACSGDSGTTGV